MSMSTTTWGRPTPSQHKVIDLTRDSPEPISTIMTPQRKRPVPHSNPTNSSTSSNASSTESVFDNDVQDTPMTPGTPVEDLQLLRAPFTETTSLRPLPQQSRLSSRGIAPINKRPLANRTTRETGSPVARSRQAHTRSVSSTTRLENPESTIEDSSHLSPGPPRTSVRRRASSGPTTSSSQRTSHERDGATDSDVHYPLIPGPSETASGDSELQYTVHTTEVAPTPTATRSTKSRVEIVAHHVSDQPCSRQSDQDDGFQRPKFEKYKLKKEKDPLSDRVVNGKIHKFLKKKQVPEPKSRSRSRSRAKDHMNDKTSRPSLPGDEILELGWVYVNESVHAPSHVKIGKTREEPSLRQKQLEECKMTLLEVTDTERNAFHHYGIVESLIKYELHRCRRTFKCTVCPKIHNEWYEIERTKAAKHVAKWRDWIKLKQPFDSSGFLTPYWAWRVRRLPMILDNVDWHAWTNPGPLDYWMYQQESSGNKSYLFLKDHLSRKDLRFCVVGIFILLLLDIWCGRMAVILGTLGLIAL